MIPPSLRTSARSAYRDVWRASSATFTGDDRVLKAFRSKMRAEAMEASLQIDETQYEEKVKYAREVAEILRRNVVQAVQTVTECAGSEEKPWKLRFTKHIELGDNDTVKSRQSSSSTRSASRSRTEPLDVQGPLAVVQHEDRPSMPRNFSALKKAHKEREIFVLDEEDLKESFVRGGGPGGQSINKTRNNVQLLHKPTGIRVSCQQTRSLQTNRMLARRLLSERLDKIKNPGLSKKDLELARKFERARQRRKKAAKRRRMEDNGAETS